MPARGSGLPVVIAGARAFSHVVGPGDGVPVGRRRGRDDGTAQRRRGQRVARDAREQARAALPPFIKEAPGPESAVRQRHRVLRARRVAEVLVRARMRDDLLHPSKDMAIHYGLSRGS